MLRLALKMLFGDTAKYLMLVAGLAVATFLMAQQTAVFCGLMNWTKSTLKNVPAPIWVVEDKVEQVNETNPLLDTDVARVRSVKSVAWASPIYSGIQRVRLENGNFKMIQLIGIDSNTLAGAPAKMLAGDLMKLRLPHSVIIDDLGVMRLARKRGEKVKVGDVFELNDQEARVVGIADAVTSFTGGPYVWTTYERALQYVPPQRKMLQAVICAPREGVSLEQAVEDIRRTTGLKAFINREAGFSEFWAQRGGGETNNFNVSTVWWYVKNTGIPISFGTTVIIGLLVGMAVSCQTFYSFVLENMRHLGALKAMGASNGTLCLMLITQAFTVGIIGYGIGLLGTSGFAIGALKNEQPPFYMPEFVPFAVLGVVLSICALAALLGIWRVSKLEPAMVFRS
ncbi:ABC transporter permease [Prosthecobacter vanneervenii]|uniref:Putative ABC transport system permease protein n=1 Tax=Prosthecobacter vanneervenii TaxID=48466 RepID=A0A7W7YG63_9BACT|nr:ABC transporter permease [Prosthecobacter vanneervenii]MBB5035250.1 putative ABC transport system permease protein [Prosthecobacter vanneervenii]